MKGSFILVACLISGMLTASITKVYYNGHAKPNVSKHRATTIYYVDDKPLECLVIEDLGMSCNWEKHYNYKPHYRYEETKNVY